MRCSRSRWGRLSGWSPTGLRIHLPVGEEIGSATRDLVARETGCCSFFSFDVGFLSTGDGAEVGVPESQVAVLDAMRAAG